MERILYLRKACLTCLSSCFRFLKALGSMGSFDCSTGSDLTDSIEETDSVSVGFADVFFFGFESAFFTAVELSIFSKFARKSASEMMYDTIDLKIICLYLENKSVYI